MSNILSKGAKNLKLAT